MTQMSSGDAESSRGSAGTGVALKKSMKNKKSPKCPNCGSTETKQATNYGKPVPGLYSCYSDLKPCVANHPALFETNDA